MNTIWSRQAVELYTGKFLVLHAVTVVSSNSLPNDVFIFKINSSLWSKLWKKHNFLQWTLLHYKMEKKPNNTNLTKLLNNNTIVYINKTNLNNSHKVQIFQENASNYERFLIFKKNVGNSCHDIIVSILRALRLYSSWVF